MFICWEKIFTFYGRGRGRRRNLWQGKNPLKFPCLHFQSNWREFSLRDTIHIYFPWSWYIHTQSQKTYNMLFSFPPFCLVTTDSDSDSFWVPSASLLKRNQKIEEVLADVGSIYMYMYVHYISVSKPYHNHMELGLYIICKDGKPGSLWFSLLPVLSVFLPLWSAQCPCLSSSLLQK